MLEKRIKNISDRFDKEVNNGKSVLYVVDKHGRDQEKKNIKPITILPEQQRHQLQMFLNKYRTNELLLVRCKESFQIVDLYFKKGDYYLLTFPGILTTYEEVPFFIHDLQVLKNDKKEVTIKIRDDSFRINSKHIFDAIEVVRSLGILDYRADKRYEYIYFDSNRIFRNKEILEILEKQQSVYCNKKIEVLTKQENGPVYKLSI